MRKNAEMLFECKSHHIERFLEVCLLLLLYDEIGYGYGLIEGLSFFGFSDSDLNMSTLYRTLRKLESEGFMTSMWEEGEQGPRKRVYEITLEGKKQLDRWIEILRDRKTRIESLITTYQEKKNDQSKL